MNVFPGDPFRRQRVFDAADGDSRPQQRWPAAVDEFRPTRKLDRGARPTVDDADRMDGAVSGVNAWDGEPVVAGELP